MKFGIENDSYV